MLKITCFGEVLWDVFPTYKKIGGAPLNVSLRLQSLGVHSTIISSIGQDQNGRELLNFLHTNHQGLSTSAIQISDDYPTSEVIVNFDNNGHANYTIKYPVAWDKIKYTPILERIVTQSDIFLFGSLICRDEVSYHTLSQLINHAKYNVFDVNLRPPHYSIHLLTTLMNKADFIKFNNEELIEIASMMGFNSHILEENIQFISQKTRTHTICVTLGDKGAILFFNNTLYYNQGYKVQVKDTVGAGDSFLASIVYKIFNNEPPQYALDFACAVGALVASNSGANPQISEDEIRYLVSQSTH